VTVVLILVALAVASSIEAGFFQVADTFGSAVGRWAWRAGWAAVLLASLVRPTRVAMVERRRRRSGQLLHPELLPGERVRRGGGGGALGAMVNGGSVVAGAFLAINVVMFFGWFVYWLFATLQREYAVEHDARLRLQQLVRLCGSDVV